MKETNILCEQMADILNVTVTNGLESLREREKKKICHKVRGTKTIFENKMNSSSHETITRG
jgi:hypothetical protein